MENGDIIVGVFVKKFKILSFLEFLYNKLKINANKVFIFGIENNDVEYLVTFSSNKKKQYFHQLHDFTVLHVKNGCLFSINALNMYIEKIAGYSEENKNFQVDWEKLRDKLMITTNGSLKVLKLTKITDKCNLLSNIA